MSSEPRSVPPTPSAKQVPSERTHHGDTVIDPYAWLTDPKDPEVIAYLEAENAYMTALTAGLEEPRSRIFEEIKARTQETDLSVPVRKGGWWRYARTVEDQQYAIYCRRRVLNGEVAPPMPIDGKPLDGEEVLLDGNELAGDAGFFQLGVVSLSPDERLLAYSTDFSGDERFTLRVKDLDSGQVLADEIPDTFYGCAWSLDGTALFYVTVDDAWRPYRVWRHLVGTPTASDVMVFEESDERFWVGVRLSRSERYIYIGTASKLTSEWWLLDAGSPEGSFAVVAPRRQGVEYSVEDAAGPAADLAQRRRRGELRARHRAAARHGRQPDLDPADAVPRRHPAARRGRVRGLYGRLLPPRRADRAARARLRRRRAGHRVP